MNNSDERLDELESSLTPKEWVTRLVSEARKYPSAFAYTKVLAKLPLHELPVQRPYCAFEEQADDRHPGRKQEDVRARHQLTDTLCTEFDTLKLLIWQVNQAMERKVENVSMQAALRLSALSALILQDAFAQTAAQTAGLLKQQKQYVAKPERQAVLKLLAAFTVGDIHETPSNQVSPQDALSRYPAPLGEWNYEFSALLKDFFAHLAAVELIQGQHFDGHSILFLNWEGELAEMARTIESAVATANEYLKRRAEFRNTETNGGTCGSNLTITLESIQAGANGQRAATIAEKWLQEAKEEAVETDEEQWDRWREEFVGKVCMCRAQAHTTPPLENAPVRRV